MQGYSFFVLFCLIVAVLGVPVLKFDDFDENKHIYTGQGRTGDFRLSGAKWDSRNLKWYYDVAGSAGSGLNIAAEKQAIRRAFKYWTDVTQLNVEEVGSRAESDFAIVAARKAHPLSCSGFNGALAHAFFPFDQTKGASSGDIHFNVDYSYSFGLNNPTYDYETVAIHEIGHALGLHHSEVKDSIMNPYYIGLRRRLDPDDVKGIQKLYGVRNVPTESPPRPTTTSRPPQSELAYDFGNLDPYRTAQLRYFTPRGTLKDWDAAMKECQSQGGLTLLHLSSWKVRENFFAKVKTPEFQRAANCGHDDRDKTCRPWIGGKVVGGKQGYPAWVVSTTDDIGIPFSKHWHDPPVMNDDWDVGNGIHIFLANPRPYMHDATSYWKRASFICEFH